MLEGVGGLNYTLLLVVRTTMLSRARARLDCSCAGCAERGKIPSEGEK